MKNNDPSYTRGKYGPLEVAGTVRNIARIVIGLGLALLALFVGFRGVNEDFAKRKTAGKAKEDDNDENENGENNNKPLKSETLDETLNKPHRSVEKFIGGLITPGEHVFVFSSPNQGKSTLSMQIAIEIASGTRSKIVKEDEPHKPQKVVVYDSEQTEQDILNRYGKFGGFPKNLERVPNCTFNNFSELLKDIEIRLRSINEDVIFVLDNLTNMLPVFSGEPARLFHKGLKNLQDEFRKKGHTITFVIVGHTKKTDPYRLPDVSHIFGSANLGNFANCILALSPTRDGEGYKMLLPIKARSFKKDGMAIVLRMVDEPYLHFEYEKSALPEDVIPLRPNKTSKGKDPDEDPSDSNHNKEVTEEDVERMKELQQEGKSYREIGEELGVSKKTVSLYIRGIQVPKKKVEQQ